MIFHRYALFVYVETPSSERDIEVLFQDFLYRPEIRLVRELVVNRSMEVRMNTLKLMHYLR